MINKYDVAVILNEILISFVQHGYEGNNIPERHARAFMKKIGYTPTDGGPVADEIVNTIGTGIYTRI